MKSVKAAIQLESEGISAAHYDIRYLKPIDEELLHEIFTRFDKIITVEDGTITGGLGSAVLEFMSDHHYKADVTRLGIPTGLSNRAALANCRGSAGLMRKESLNEF